MWVKKSEMVAYDELVAAIDWHWGIGKREGYFMEKISSFYANLGVPLRNPRWSWGARSDLFVLLTSWEDGLDATRRFVRALGKLPPEHSHPGFNERIDHLRTLWSGGIAGYTVIAKAKDPKARPRKIQAYDNGSVYSIISLVTDSDGVVWAELGETVPIHQLKRHAAHHRLIPNEDAFPIDRKLRKNLKPSSAGYVAQLPAMRKWLIDVARRRGTVTYAEARAPFGLRSLEHRHAMDRLGHECVDAGEPILTSLIINATTGRCSDGFVKEFHRDDLQERLDCYAFWSPVVGTIDVPFGEGRLATSGSQQNETLQGRAARFARVAARPEQAAFRRRVFLEHNGACVVTGCAIPEALDAAHRERRDWRLGHNNGSDGLLLRKDVHALYDAKLISIDDAGTVVFRQDVEEHYRNYLHKS